MFSYGRDWIGTYRMVKTRKVDVVRIDSGWVAFFHCYVTLSTHTLLLSLI